MKIIYIANHHRAQTSNDEEGAISYALEKLGHTVTKLLEHETRGEIKEKGDVLLFHHWDNYNVIKSAKMLKVFWCFDPIECKTEPELYPRWRLRKQWIEELTRISDVGFLTDGDWVRQDRTGKLHWLCQAADERNYHAPINVESDKILFTGIHDHGKVRESFVKWIRDKFKERFVQVQEKIHGQRLVKLMQQFRIIVAPDGPLGDYYWSNRVYLTLGYGGFLLHPYTVGIEEHYKSSELVCYQSRNELEALIEYYINNSSSAFNLAQSGHIATIERHNYTQRCKQLIETVIQYM